MASLFAPFFIGGFEVALFPQRFCFQPHRAQRILFFYLRQTLDRQFLIGGAFHVEDDRGEEGKLREQHPRRVCPAA